MIAPSSPPSSPELRPFSAAEICHLNTAINRCTELQSGTRILIQTLIQQSNQLQQSQTVVFRSMPKQLSVIQANLQVADSIHGLLATLDDGLHLTIHDGQLMQDSAGFLKDSQGNLVPGLTISLWREGAPAADLLEGTEAMYSESSARHSIPQHVTLQSIESGADQRLSFAS
jgi:hypothetical protein